MTRQSETSRSEFIPPFSKSADANKDHILEQLQACLKPHDKVLEIASGTGQHAVHFSQHMPDIVWQSSDLDLTTFGLEQVIAAHPRPNLPTPLRLDIGNWPPLAASYNAVYSANCIHIIGSELLAPYVAGAARSLGQGGLMLLYGPYKYDGDFTTESNAGFDQFLRSTYDGGGIKDFEMLDQLATDNGLELESDTAMPANNQFLIWRKTG
ncbi:MAG: DUF938 domain-containing protein [Rhizobiaceae bacterium]